MMRLFNLLLSPIGRVASWPKSNVETFPSKLMYLYLSLVERKVAAFYHDIDRRRYLVWLKLLVFIALSGQLMVSLFSNSEATMLSTSAKSFILLCHTYPLANKRVCFKIGFTRQYVPVVYV